MNTRGSDSHPPLITLKCSHTIVISFAQLPSRFDWLPALALWKRLNIHVDRTTLITTFAEHSLITKGKPRPQDIDSLQRDFLRHPAWLGLPDDPQIQKHN